MPIFVENGVYVIKERWFGTVPYQIPVAACRHVDYDQHHYGYQGDMSAQLVSCSLISSPLLLCDAGDCTVFVVMAQHLRSELPAAQRLRTDVWHLSQAALKFFILMSLVPAH